MKTFLLILAVVLAGLGLLISAALLLFLAASFKAGVSALKQFVRWKEAP